MIEIPKIQPIRIGNKEISTPLLLGSVVFIFLIGISLVLHLAPTKIVKTGLGDLELQIVKKIGAAYKVESKEQAVQSIGTIAQDLEKARGSLSSLNKNLEKGETDTGTGPSGLFGISNNLKGVAGILAGIVVISIALKLIVRKD